MSTNPTESPYVADAQLRAKVHDDLNDATARCAERLRDLLDNADRTALVRALVEFDTDQTDAEDMVQLARDAVRQWKDASNAFLASLVRTT